MIKIYLDEEGMFPVYTLDPPLQEREGGPVYNTEVSEDLFARYQKAMAEFHEVQNILQDMFNKKKGLI